MLVSELHVTFLRERKSCSLKSSLFLFLFTVYYSVHLFINGAIVTTRILRKCCVQLLRTRVIFRGESNNDILKITNCVAKFCAKDANE